jgi:plasmid stability protein
MALPNDPEKATILVHDISPDLEQELIKRAKARHHDASAEASEIIERHVDGEDGGIA